MIKRARGLLPALRVAGVGHRRSPAIRCSRSATSARSRRPRKASRLAEAAADARRQRRLGGAAARRAAGRLGIPIRQSALSRPRRHRRGGDGDGPGAEPRRTQATSRRRSRARGEWIVGLQSQNGGWGAFDADNEYHYLNNIPFADHGALLDPPTEDVTARCVSMLAQLGETRGDEPGGRARRSTICARRSEPDGSWYRPLGHELHLRHLVGAVRAQRRRRRSPRRPRSARPSPGSRASRMPDGGWGEDGDELPARLSRLRAGAEHGLADRLGAARPDGGGRGRSSGGRARHRLSRCARRRPTGSGTRSATPRPVSRACSICAITAIAKFFPLWAMARYRNLKRGNARRWRTGCDAVTKTQGRSEH